MVCSDDEQYRLTVTPGASRPAMMPATRAMFAPASPAGWPQPQITSSTSERSSSGTLSSTAPMINADRSSGRQSINDPLLARPIGVRPVATITASVMFASFVDAAARRLALSRDLR
jgi:hypothetical protein